ncbi:MAG: hypothetical protein KF906_10255 [Actinobacteria bacterium]|nr:hypothetical protein [Actinomycetota bacterium]
MAILIVLGSLAFLIVGVLFVEVLQPAIKRLAASIIDQLGGTRSVAIGFGMATGAAAVVCASLAMARWRHADPPERIVLAVVNLAVVTLAVGMSPQAQSGDYDRERTLDAVGNVQDARLVDTATNAMLPTLLVLGGSVYLVRRRRSDAARI